MATRSQRFKAPRPATYLVAPRLLRRPQAAAYLNISASQLDALRARGELVAVPIPSDRDPRGTMRTPLFDLRDVDALVEKWKATRV